MVILEKFEMLSMSLMSAKGRPYRCKLFCLYYETRTACMEHDVLNKNRACQLNKHEMTCEHATTNLEPNHFLMFCLEWFSHIFTLFVAMNTLDMACHVSNKDFRNRYRSEWNGLFFVVENNHVLQHCPETFLRETNHWHGSMPIYCPNGLWYRLDILPTDTS